MTGLPLMLAETRYSREFETEADEFAFRLLKRSDLSPAAFATLLERLNEKGGAGNISFLSTHPITRVRIERARAAAADPTS